MVIQAGEPFSRLADSLPARIYALLAPCATKGRLTGAQRRNRIGIYVNLLWLLAVRSTVDSRLKGPWVDSRLNGSWQTAWFTTRMVNTLRSLKDSQDLNDYYTSQVSLQRTVINGESVTPDFTAAVQLQCTIAVLIHRAIEDLSHQVQIGDVKIYAPPGWDMRKVFAQIQDHDHGLFEAMLFAKLLSLSRASPFVDFKFSPSLDETHRINIYADSTALA